MHMQNTAFVNQKRKIESELNIVKNEVEMAINVYRGRKCNEMPPHLYVISDTTYQRTLTYRENQSIC